MAENHDIEQAPWPPTGARFVTFSRVGLVVGVIGSYVFIVEGFSIYPMHYPRPGASTLVMRTGEAGALWVVLWMILGWKAALRDRTGCSLLDILFVSLPPFLSGLAITSWQLVGFVPLRMPVSYGWLGWILPLFPLVYGIGGAGLLLMQGWVWRKYSAKPLHGCRSCAYDLTGNVSGVCPECGTTVVPTPEEIARTRRRMAVMSIIGGVFMIAIATASMKWPENSFFPRTDVGTAVLAIVGPILFFLTVVDLWRNKK